MPFRGSQALAHLVHLVGTALVLVLSRLRLVEIPANDLGVIRDGDFRVLQVRMPGLFPLEAEVALVAYLPERLDLPLDGHVAPAREHIFALLAGRHGI